MNEPPIEPPITCIAVTSPSPPNRITKPATTAAIPTGQSTTGHHELCLTCRCSHPGTGATSRPGPRGSGGRRPSPDGRSSLTKDRPDVLADGRLGDDEPLADRLVRHRRRARTWAEQEAEAGAWGLRRTALAVHDDQERRGRRLLLGKGAVLGHRLAYPLAAESDESEQRPSRDAGRRSAAPLISERVH